MSCSNPISLLKELGAVPTADVGGITIPARSVSAAGMKCEHLIDVPKTKGSWWTVTLVTGKMYLFFVYDKNRCQGDIMIVTWYADGSYADVTWGNGAKETSWEQSREDFAEDARDNNTEFADKTIQLTPEQARELLSLEPVPTEEFSDGTTLPVWQICPVGTWFLCILVADCPLGHGQWWKVNTATGDLWRFRTGKVPDGYTFMLVKWTLRSDGECVPTVHPSTSFRSSLGYYQAENEFFKLQFDWRAGSKKDDSLLPTPPLFSGSNSRGINAFLHDQMDTSSG